MSLSIENAVKLLREARYAEAEAAFVALLQQDDANADVLHGLSIIAFQRGDKSRAERMLEELLAKEPKRISARYDLACMLIEQERDAEAKAHLIKIVNDVPDHANAWYQLGFVYRMQGLVDEAKRAFLSSVRLSPGHAQAINDLARIHRESGDYEHAISAFESAAEASDVTPALYQMWGQFASLSALPHQALNALQRGVARFPADAEIRIGLAQALEGAGAKQNAELQYRIALSLDGERGYAVGSLLSLLGDAADAAIVTRAEQLLADPAARVSAKAVIGYGLGKVYQSRGDYDAAFDAWSQANRARRAEAGALDRSALVDQIEEAKRSFRMEDLRALAPFGSDDDRLLFIVGMPRSGTTLVEQIIGSHSAAVGLGELPDMPIIAENFCKAFGSKAHWPSCSAIVDSSKQPLASAAKHYQRILQYRLPQSAPRIIDKAPLNFFNLGLIGLLFPKARIIWCRRDPRDVCLSIYSENFAQNQKYASDLADLGFYYRQHEKLMDHWRNVLVNPLREVVYEELIGDQEAQTRSLIEFAGLPWESACLNFYQSARLVQTPSRWQVRKPMYTSSIGRWRHYERWLPPLLKELAMAETGP